MSESPEDAALIEEVMQDNIHEILQIEGMWGEVVSCFPYDVVTGMLNKVIIRMREDTAQEIDQLKSTIEELKDLENEIEGEKDEW